MNHRIYTLQIAVNTENTVNYVAYVSTVCGSQVPRANGFFFVINKSLVFVVMKLCTEKLSELLYLFARFIAAPLLLVRNDSK